MRVYDKRGWTLAVVRLGFEFWLFHTVAFKFFQVHFYIPKWGDYLFHWVERIDEKT